MDRRIAHDEDIVPDSQTKQLTFNPFNPKNVQIELHEVNQLLKRYGVAGNVGSLHLYRRAFVHSSYCERPYLEGAPHVFQPKCPANCLPLCAKSNERLEFLGDGVLELVAKYYLYRRFSKENEGFMTEKKIALVRNDAIGKLALDMGLDRWFVMSKHNEDKKCRSNLKKLGCLFEAFVGALFLDFNKDDNVSGFQTAQIFLENVFEAHVDWTAIITNDNNYKNKLQVRLQKEFKTTPEYIELGHDNVRGYTMGAFLCIGQPIYALSPKQAQKFDCFKNFDNVRAHLKQHGKIFLHLGSGVHKLKKNAEQMSCECALKQFEAQ
jgi:dsRNA-specific ribonuclease